jgi:hypothetical protein
VMLTKSKHLLDKSARSGGTNRAHVDQAKSIKFVMDVKPKFRDFLWPSI